MGAFYAGLITAFRTPSFPTAPAQMTMLDYAPLALEPIDVLRTPAASKGWSAEELEFMMRQLRNKYHPDQIDVHDEDIQLIISGMVCPNKGGVHQSNKTYLHVKIPFKMAPGEFHWDIKCPSVFCCADTADCGKFHWAGPDFADLIYACMQPDATTPT